MKSSYIVFAKYTGKVQQIRTVKCADPFSEKIGELRLPGERFVTIIGHFQGKLKPKKAQQVISQRKNWAEYFRKTLPLPFTKEEVIQMIAAVGFRGEAEKLMLQLRMGSQLEGKKPPEKEEIFNHDVKPALKELSLKEAAVVILVYGLKDDSPVMIYKLAKMFGLTRGSIERIIKEAIAIMFGSISLSKVRGYC